MNPIQFFILTLVMLTAATAPVFAASTGQIVGTISDAGTKHPVAGAEVTATSPTGSYHTFSDARGEFAIVGVTPDTYVVSFQAKGYYASSEAGVTVTTDESSRVTITLARALKTIGQVRARPLTSAYQPDQTVDRYTLNATGIAQLLGKTFNTDQKQLLQKLPGVTIDKNGTALIRGGFSYQTAFQFEGIDYTEPNRSVINRFENVGNSNVLNGAGSLEIIPGGGDATHGNTGTGLVAITAKRGTYPAFSTVDVEQSLFRLGRQFGFEFGVASKHAARLSNFISYVAEDTNFQWGPYRTDPASIGASAIALDPSENSNLNAHSGALYTTAFYNPKSQHTSDFIDNLVYKFGRDNHEQLQFFMQSQNLSQDLDYGGYHQLTVADPASVADRVFALRSFQYIFGEANQPQLYIPQMRPYLATVPSSAAPGQPLNAPESNSSPFTAYKLEYQNNLTPSSSLGVRAYRTRNDQQQYLASQGIFVPDNGGTRTGVSADFSKVYGAKHYLQIGGKYEFAHPFGSRSDDLDYVSAYDNVNFGAAGTFLQIPYVSAGNVVPDFIVPSAATPGCAGQYNVPGNGNPYTNLPFNCGYLSKYFPGGAPPLPYEREIPTANQQVYALYAQDTLTPNTRLKLLLGVRLDGYNFLLPNDPQNPPAVTGIRHQRLLEPHLGASYKFSNRDALRFNYGRTLAIPLPTFLGNNIDPSVFNAFKGIPSYDNASGKPAMYCGPGSLGQTAAFNGQTIFGGNQPCKDYADQLYWLVRNYRFSTQSQLTYPLRGATFTNYDVSYSHEFRNGSAVKVTPFYRRGYDVVEATRTLLGFDEVTGAALYTPEQYSNLGLQHATGVELFATTPVKSVGMSGQVSATYVNQFGNDPPGGFLPTASLQLGKLYHSPNLAPFQATLALTYRTENGWKINPVFTLRSGYPYGTGVYEAITYNGAPIFVPITDALFGSSQTSLLVPAQVNPQNPGTIFAPNIVATRGTEALNSGPGSLRSAVTLKTDVNLEYSPGKGPLTYGLAIRNLFDNTADIPVLNLTRDCQPVSTGVCAGPYGAMTSHDATHSSPSALSGTTSPYIVFPNQEPITIRFYLQVKL